MAKPLVHAKSSARKFGGEPEDYLDIHQFMDSSKAHIGDNRHRAIFHSSLGCFLVEEVFGKTRKNSVGDPYSTRDVAEQHCVEDMGFIPSLSDYLSEMNLRPWMCGVRADKPDSQKNLKGAGFAKKDINAIASTNAVKEAQYLKEMARD